MSDDSDGSDANGGTGIGALMIACLLIIFYFCYNSCYNRRSLCYCLCSGNSTSASRIRENAITSQEQQQEEQNDEERGGGSNQQDDSNRGGATTRRWMSKQEKRFDIECQLYTKRYYVEKQQKESQKVDDKLNNNSSLELSEHSNSTGGDNGKTEMEVPVVHEEEEDNNNNNDNDEEEDSSTNVTDLEQGRDPPGEIADSQRSEIATTTDQQEEEEQQREEGNEPSNSVSTTTDSRASFSRTTSISSTSSSTTNRRRSSIKKRSLSTGSSSHSSFLNAITKNVQSWFNDVDNTDKHVCLICLCEYEEGDEISWSPNSECSHEFHTDCIVDWLSSPKNASKGCPICRRPYLHNKDASTYTV